MGKNTLIKNKKKGKDANWFWLANLDSITFKICKTTSGYNPCNSSSINQKCKKKILNVQFSFFGRVTPTSV
jgi:hypothetical protein